MSYKKEIDINEVVEYIDQFSDSTRVYIGTDSEKYRKNNEWWASYISVVVVHVDGKHGCRIFGCVVDEKDYDQNKHRPAMRMMSEVRKSCELYNKVFDAMVARPEIALNMEIHLDINHLEEHGSSCVVNEAIGYVKGVCGIEPQIKPDAFSASYAADRYKEIVGLKYSENIKKAA